MQDVSQPVMTVDEITRRLEELDAALRVVEAEGRELEEKIRKGITNARFSPNRTQRTQRKNRHRHTAPVLAFWLLHHLLHLRLLFVCYILFSLRKTYVSCVTYITRIKKF